MLDALFQGGGPSDRERQEVYAGTLAQLARIRSAKWVGEDAATAECAVALVGDLKVLIPLKGLVDVDEELARLNRQLERETAELRKSEAKLGNSRFVENAPAAVVEQERERLAAYRAAVEKLHAQMRQLESLSVRREWPVSARSSRVQRIFPPPPSLGRTRRPGAASE
jgi:valyl-tRNA synthetase